MRPALIACGVLGLAALVFGLVALRRDDAEALLVDEHAGTLHGVRFGDSESDVRTRLGQETDDRAGYFPAGRQYTGPFAIPVPASNHASRIAPSELHYRDDAYLVSATAGVFSMTTLDGSAQTRAGVGVGDELALVRERYARVSCGDAVGGESLLGRGRTYPWCRALVGDTRVFFGADPIASITITRYPR